MLKLRHLLLAGCALLALTPVVAGGPAFSQSPETSQWGTVGNWTVMVDQTIKNSCFAVAAWQQGATVRIGLDKRDNSAFILYHNANFPELEVGKLFKLRMTFEDGSWWDGDWTATRLSGGRGKYTYLAINVDYEFVLAFMKRHRVQITTRSGNVLDTLGLAGSSAALVEVARCQEAQGTPAPARPRSTDPSV